MEKPGSNKTENFLELCKFHKIHNVPHSIQLRQLTQIHRRFLYRYIRMVLELKRAEELSAIGNTG